MTNTSNLQLFCKCFFFLYHPKFILLFPIRKRTVFISVTDKTNYPKINFHPKKNSLICTRVYRVSRPNYIQLMALIQRTSNYILHDRICKRAILSTTGHQISSRLAATKATIERGPTHIYT